MSCQLPIAHPDPLMPCLASFRQGCNPQKAQPSSEQAVAEQCGEPSIGPTSSLLPSTSARTAPQAYMKKTPERACSTNSSEQKNCGSATLTKGLTGSSSRGLCDS